MRKNYMTPALTCEAIVIDNVILTGSPTAKVEPEKPLVEPGEIESRRPYNIWADEEEEEEQY